MKRTLFNTKNNEELKKQKLDDTKAFEIFKEELSKYSVSVNIRNFLDNIHDCIWIGFNHINSDKKSEVYYTFKILFHSNVITFSHISEGKYNDCYQKITFRKKYSNGTTIFYITEWNLENWIECCSLIDLNYFEAVKIICIIFEITEKIFNIEFRMMNHFTIGLLDLLGTKWTKKEHKNFPSSCKNIIKTLLILNLKNSETRKPKYEETLFYLLPKEILTEIFQFLDVI